MQLKDFPSFHFSFVGARLTRFANWHNKRTVWVTCGFWEKPHALFCFANIIAVWQKMEFGLRSKNWLEQRDGTQYVLSVCRVRELSHVFVIHFNGRLYLPRGLYVWDLISFEERFVVFLQCTDDSSEIGQEFLSRYSRLARFICLKRTGLRLYFVQRL